MCALACEAKIKAKVLKERNIKGDCLEGVEKGIVVYSSFWRSSIYGISKGVSPGVGVARRKPEVIVSRDGPTLMTRLLMLLPSKTAGSIVCGPNNYQGMHSRFQDI